ncbi:MAG: enoyl-CoA hydratase-related protein [Acidimicrobiales bacterium]
MTGQDASTAGLSAVRSGWRLNLVLSRPGRRNALDGPTVAALTGRLSDPGDARFVVLTGQPPSFCAGADTASLAEAGSLEDHAEESMALHRMLEAAATCPVPLVVGVQGHALGAGCALAACADIVVADRNAYFGVPEVRAGVIPAIVAPFISRRMLGAGRRYMLSGSQFDAAEAQRTGLVDLISDDLDAQIEGLAWELGRCGPTALRQAKRLFTESPSPEAQAQMMAELRAGEEAQEGLAALRERRNPSWTEVADD